MKKPKINQGKIVVKQAKSVDGKKRWRVKYIAENGEPLAVTQVLDSKAAVFKNIFAMSDLIGSIKKNKDLLEFQYAK